MTRRDFVLIADTIRVSGLDEQQRHGLARLFADVLSTTNPNFQRARFIAACLQGGT